jgi:hypothetical protein
MKKSARALIGLLLIDAFKLLGAAWMVWQVKIEAWRAPDPAAAIFVHRRGN